MKYLIFPLKIYTQSLEHEMDICKAQEAHSLNSGTRFTETSCFHFTEFQAFWIQLNVVCRILLDILSIHLVPEPHYKFMSCRKEKEESMRGLTSDPLGRGLSQWCQDSDTAAPWVCSCFLYIGETYLQCLRKTKKARLKIEHRGMTTFMPFKQPCFSSVCSCLLWEGRKREREL